MPKHWRIAILLLAAALAPSLEAKGSGSYSGTRSSSGVRSSAARSPRISGGLGRNYGGSSARSSSPRVSPGTRSSSGSTRCSSCSRNSAGRIARSPQAKREFQRSNPCPSTGHTSGACPGYVVDHVMPLKRGGADAPSNMEWQTTEAAKAKDRTE